MKVYHIEKIVKDYRKVKKENGELLSNTTVQKYYGVLNSALNRAVKLQLIIDNPCKNVDTPKRNKYIASVLSLEEYKMIYNDLGSTKYNDYIFKLALNITVETGLKRGEMCGICWKDVDFVNSTISINKALKREKNRNMVSILFLLVFCKD